MAKLTLAQYWNMPEGNRTMRDLILYIRADEAGHRGVNHTLGNLNQNEDPNPFVSTFKDREMPKPSLKPGGLRAIRGHLIRQLALDRALPSTRWLFCYKAFAPAAEAILLYDYNVQRILHIAEFLGVGRFLDMSFGAHIFPALFGEDIIAFKLKGGLKSTENEWLE